VKNWETYRSTIKCDMSKKLELKDLVNISIYFLYPTSVENTIKSKCIVLMIILLKEMMWTSLPIYCLIKKIYIYFSISLVLPLFYAR